MNYTIVTCGFCSSPLAPWEQRQNVPFGTKPVIQWHGATFRRRESWITPLYKTQITQVGFLFTNALPEYSRNNIHCMNLDSPTQRTVEESTHGSHPSRNSISDWMYVGYRNMDYNTPGSKNVSKWTTLHYVSLRMSIKLTDYIYLTSTAHNSCSPRHRITDFHRLSSIRLLRHLGHISLGIVCADYLWFVPRSTLCSVHDSRWKRITIEIQSGRTQLGGELLNHGCMWQTVLESVPLSSEINDVNINTAFLWI